MCVDPEALRAARLAAAANAASSHGAAAGGATTTSAPPASTFPPSSSSSSSGAAGLKKEEEKAAGAGFDFAVDAANIPAVSAVPVPVDPRPSPSRGARTKKKKRALTGGGAARGGRASSFSTSPRAVSTTTNAVVGRLHTSAATGTTATGAAAGAAEGDEEDEDEDEGEDNPSRKRRVLTPRPPPRAEAVAAARAPPPSCAMDFASLLTLLDGAPASLKPDAAAAAAAGFVADNIVRRRTRRADDRLAVAATAAADDDVDMQCDKHSPRRDGGGMGYDGVGGSLRRADEDFSSVEDMIWDVAGTALDDDLQHLQPPTSNLQHLLQSGAPSAGLFSSSLGPDMRLQSLQSTGSSVSDLFAMHAHRLQDAASFTTLHLDTILALYAAAAAAVGDPRTLQARAPDAPLPAAAGVVLRTSKGREILGPSWNATSPVPTDRRVLLAGPTGLLPSAADVMTMLTDMVGPGQ
jgi:hypothetical protein